MSIRAIALIQKRLKTTVRYAICQGVAVIRFGIEKNANIFELLDMVSGDDT